MHFGDIRIFRSCRFISDIFEIWYSGLRTFSEFRIFSIFSDFSGNRRFRTFRDFGIPSPVAFQIPSLTSDVCHIRVTCATSLPAHCQLTSGLPFLSSGLVGTDTSLPRHWQVTVPRHPTPNSYIRVTFGIYQGIGFNALFWYFSVIYTNKSTILVKFLL